MRSALNPIALRVAKIICTFGLPECSRVKGNICYRARFIKCILHFGREANRKSQKLFPFLKMVEKHYSIPIHLNQFVTNYSRLSLSRLRLSRITAYLEEKIWSLFKHRSLTSGNKILWLRGKIAPQEQFFPFSAIFSIYISN